MYVVINFLWMFPSYLLYFTENFQKTDNFDWNCRFFENYRQNTLASMETFTENWLRRNFAFHFTSYSSIALSKILPYSKAIKNTKKLPVFGENDSRRLSILLQTHIFWSFDHISTIYNQINYRNIWFPKVIIILIMTAEVLFFNFFSEKDLHLNAVEQSFTFGFYYRKIFKTRSRWRLKNERSECVDERSPCVLSVTGDIKIYQCHVIER